MAQRQLEVAYFAFLIVLICKAWGTNWVKCQPHVIGYKRQREWGWLIAIALFLSGLGAGTFIVSQFYNYPWGALTGVLATLLGALFLLKDLGQPLRFWRALLRPGTSWISRGVIFIGLFTVFGLLSIIPSWSWGSGLPWSGETAPGKAIEGIGHFSAFLVVLYTGFVIAASPAIPFWNTLFVPLQFTAYAILGGADVVILLDSTTNIVPSVTMADLEFLQLILLGVSLFIILSYILNVFSSSAASKESGRLLLRKELALYFLGGVILIGLVAPLALASLYYFEIIAATAPLLVANAALILGGSLLFRYSLLQAGLYLPPI